MMQRALALAASGVGLVSPNPLVGCVIVSASGEIVGEGCYTYEGVTHAETAALATAGQRARGGTAYVSLEPHDHHGKTPPCTDALIRAGIARVVCPIEDPNPLVSGSGFRRLREAGIEVLTGVMADEASRQNEKFICWHKMSRPFVHLKLAMSLDGRISVGSSVSTLLSGPAASKRVHALRHEHDAILIGGNTAVVDDPSLTDRSGLPRRRPLLRVILDDRLRCTAVMQIAKTARTTPTLIFTKPENGDRTKALTECGVDVAFLAAGGRDLPGVLNQLKDREIQSVLVEGGTQVAGAFWDAGLVDKLTFIAAPIIIGGSSAPVAIGGNGVDAISDAVRLRDITVERLGDDIEITGYPIHG